MAGGSEKTLVEVIRRALDLREADLHVSLPGRVERVDLARGLVDVKPLVHDSRQVDGVRVLLPFPVITNVPVQFPGAGAFRITFPVGVGDACTLLFSDRSLDLWISKGGEVDPVDDRRHALSDAVALLGVRDAAHPWGNVAADAMTIGHDAGGPRAAFKADALVLDGGTKAVARSGDAVKAASVSPVPAPGDMAFWIAAVTAALNVAGPVAGADGALVAPTNFGTVNEGAARVKA